MRSGLRDVYFGTERMHPGPRLRAQFLHTRRRGRQTEFGQIPQQGAGFEHWEKVHSSSRFQVCDSVSLKSFWLETEVEVVVCTFKSGNGQVMVIALMLALPSKLCMVIRNNT